MTKENILDYLKSHKEEFRQKYGVEKIGIFGSYARDEASDDSDIDVFTIMKPSLFAMVGLKQQIEEDLKKDVDLIRNHKNIRPFLYQMIQEDILYV